TSSAQQSQAQGQPTATPPPSTPAQSGDTAAPPPPPPRLTTGQRWLNRGVGVLQLVGGGIEIVGGGLGGAATCLETFGAGCVGGVVLILHGVDTGGHGIAAIVSGEPRVTFTHQAGAGLAKAAGATDTQARWVGTGLDVGM